MARTRKQTASPEERAARRQADRERLEQAARQMLTSEGCQAWIRVRSSNGLARYSVGNLMLIAMQTGGRATFVAGFRAWLNLDRCVRKGEKAIRILAPMPVKTKDDGDRDADEDGVRVLFKSVPVFDTLSRDRDRRKRGGAVTKMLVLVTGVLEERRGGFRSQRGSP